MNSIRRSVVPIGTLGFIVATGCLFTITLDAADTPSVEVTLNFRPVQPDIDIEQPTPAEYKQCSVKVERQGKASGWAVIGAAGQVLRRYVDTNGDNVVDQWRYYNHGLEVYRDIDSNFNRKVDQSRWLNLAGSRWGIDSNEDGRIDSWHTLSAEEATRVAVQALITADAKTLESVLINRQDMRDLGVNDELTKQLAAATADVESRLRSLLQKTRIVQPTTKWMRFDCSMPGVIPAEDGKAREDLHVYENAMAIIETKNKTSLVQIGEMIRVGDVWKLTQLPQPIEGNSIQITEGGILMRPGQPGATSVATGTTVSPETQRLLKQLQELDAKSPAPTASAATVAQYNTQRAEVLSRLSQIATTDQEREQWLRQMVDGLATAVQTGGYATGLQRLKQVESQTRRTSAQSSLTAYVTYRRMLAEYSVAVQQTSDNKKRQAIQDDWLKSLEAFVKEYPTADDASEAMLQLAISHEFAGKLDDAKKWYGTLVSQHGDSTAGVRATGALNRINLKGKLLTFSGSGLDGGTIDVRTYRGKVVLVSFWSTWCVPCTQDLPRIRALYEQYHDRGFEIIGVNLDSTLDPVRPFLQQNRVTWPQIYEPGGLTSKPATTFGIISLPTIFLVDPDGRVVNRGATVDDVKTFLANQFK